MSERLRLENKVALITGAGKGGVGDATARLFWEEGAFVVVTDVEAEAVQQVAREIDPRGERVIAIPADLSREEEAARLVLETVAKFGKLDVLANIAAVRTSGKVTTVTADSWQFILGVNLLGVAFCCKFAVPEMIKAGGGSIINVSSSMAEKGRPGMAQYDASKAAVLALTRSMAADHVGDNIRVNSVCPGIVMSLYQKQSVAKRDKISLAQAEENMQAWAATGNRNLMKRWGQPREIANGILFLASDESSYMTGANLMLQGGFPA